MQYPPTIGDFCTSSSSVISHLAGWWNLLNCTLPLSSVQILTEGEARLYFSPPTTRGENTGEQRDLRRPLCDAGAQ